MSENKYFIGVDVGTGSARAALVNANGKVLANHVEVIKTWNPQPNHYEQSSSNIWTAVCKCVQIITKNINKTKICGIGFDGTCSLVAIDKNDKPITISTTENNEQNIILWMDHRATKQTTQINETKHELLKYVGGNVSLEMQCPKLLWIKENLIKTWLNIGQFFDLPDYLTFKATGVDTRSLCSVVCKWNYDGFENKWSKDFFTKVKLSELCENNFHILGGNIQEPGSSIGNGLCESAAIELGLPLNIPVGTSMIDAHAGALGLFGITGNNVSNDLLTKMALICGTSSCHMSLTKSPIWANGVWGPYKGALFPEMYLHEAGQSATGILLDFIVESHPAYEKANKLAQQSNKHIFEYLNELIYQLIDKNCHDDTDKFAKIEELTIDLHVWPDFHGNRSPLADSTLKGMISGLNMSTDINNLAILYLAFIQSLAYGTRHILESLKENGRPDYSTLIICGGLAKNQLFVKTHADACGLPVMLPNESEMVLVGSAILGACASGYYQTLQEASMAMGGGSDVIQPNKTSFKYHQKKYNIFLKMLNDQKEYQQIMC